MTPEEILKNNPALMKLAKGKRGFNTQYTDLGRYLWEIQSARIKDAVRLVAELKVLEAEQTDNGTKPHDVGAIDSYVENFSNDETGGGGRVKNFVFTVLNKADADVAEYRIESKDATGTKVVERVTGEMSEALWLNKFLDDPKQPLAFRKIAGEVFRKKGKQYTSHRWFFVEMSEVELAEAESKRAAAKLPSFADALK